MRFWMIPLVGMALVACGGGGAGGPKKGALKVGLIVPETQRAIPNLGFEHATAGLQAASKGAGRSFELFYGDSVLETSAPALAAAAQFKTQGVQAILVDVYVADIAVNKLNYDADVSKRLGVPLVCPGCISPDVNNPQATSTDAVEQATLRDDDKWNFVPVGMILDEMSALAQVLLSKGNGGDVNNDGVVKFSIIGTESGLSAGELFTLAGVLGAAAPTAIVEKIILPGTFNPNSRDWAADVAMATDNYNEETSDTDGYPDAVIQTFYFDYMTAFLTAYTQSTAPRPLFSTTVARLLIKDLGGVPSAVVEKLEGMEGVSYISAEKNASGDLYKTVVGATDTGAQLTSNFYDASILTALASVAASEGVEDPSTVTGAQIRDAFAKLNDPAGTVIRPGPDEFAKAVDLLAEGKTINYEGASGPCDFDATQRSKSRFVRWVIDNENFVEHEHYDCVGDMSCPPMP